MSTTVRNPMHRAGERPYRHCAWCGGMFTRLGLPRHWDRCPKRPR